MAPLTLRGSPARAARPLNEYEFCCFLPAACPLSLFPLFATQAPQSPLCASLLQQLQLFWLFSLFVSFASLPSLSTVRAQSTVLRPFSHSFSSCLCARNLCILTISLVAIVHHHIKFCWSIRISHMMEVDSRMRACTRDH